MIAALGMVTLLLPGAECGSPLLAAPSASDDFGREQEFIHRTWQTHGPFTTKDEYFFLGALVRETTLRGDWYDDGLEDDDYGDLFKPGNGLVGEIGGMFPYQEHARAGMYLSVGWDTYPGDSVDGPGGVRIEADDMNILTILLGFRGMFRFAEILFVEGHAAAGAAYYREVDATMGGITGELFASSVVPSGEAGVRFGLEISFLQAEIGAGYRFQGGPSRGDEASRAVDPDPMGCLFIEVGGALRF